MKRCIFVVIAVLLMLTLSACACEHEWKDATCLEPQICSLCEETQGEPLGHKWKDATCSAPKTCSLCSEAQGNPLEHRWIDATCTTPKTCADCGKTNGSALNHTEGSWKTYSSDMIDATVTSKKYCTVCEVELDEQTVALQQLYFGDTFMATPVEFVSRFDKMLDRIAGNTLSAYSGSALDEFACGIFDGDNRVGLLLFGTGNGTVTVDQKNSPCFATILGSADDAKAYSNIMIALVLASNPSLSFNEAVEVAMTATEKGQYTSNGITYCVEFPSSGAVFSISISE